MRTEESSIEGYNLFSDVEDKDTRIQHQATTLANIAEDNLYSEEGGVLSQQGMYLSMKYFNELPEDERKEVYDLFEGELKSRGMIPGVN